MRRLTFTILYTFFSVTPLLAQLKYADRLYEENDLESAAVLYEKVLEKDSDQLVVIERLAYCYKKMTQYDKAEKYFGKAVKYENADAESFLNYGQLLKNNNKIKQAKHQFQEFLNRKPESLIGKIMMASCDAIGEWTSKPSEFRLENLKAVNTKFLEIAPFPFESKLVFTSDKNYMEQGEEGKVKKSFDGYAYAIYIYDSTNREKPIQSFSNSINTQNNIEGPAYFNRSLDKIFFTKVYDRQRRMVNQMEVHMARREGNGWGKDKSLDFNKTDYSFTNAIISNDEKRLYFASDMSGGAGGFDIYYCELTDKGYVNPVNVGTPVNTTGNEIPSYIDEHGNLYFSSDFHPGFGGFDIFKSSKIDGKWSVPENLKSPFNSTKDELGYILMDSLSGYFSSNRDGGAGKDDIYFFTHHSFSDSNYYTDISGLFLLDTLPMIKMSLILLDENDEIVQTVITDQKGRFTFSNVAAKVHYKILIDEDPDSLPDEARIYLTDERYQKIMLIDRLKKGLFKFRALERQGYAGLSLMDEVDDEGRPTLTVFGQMTNPRTGEIESGRRIFIVNDRGEVIATSVSDRLGKFQFTKLAIDDEYLFKLEEEDLDIDIHILSKDGKTIGRTVKNKDGIYVYHKFTINPSGNPDIRGLFKYGNLPADGVILMLINEYDEIIQLTTTNVKGEFEFSGLNSGSSYRIQVDSNLKVPGNANMFLMDKHTGMLMPVSKIANGMFHFTTLSPIAPEELALLKEEDYVIKPRHDLKGQVYNSDTKQAPIGLEVQVQDEKGRTIAIAKTNDRGEFRFFNLPIQDEYLFHLPEDDPNFKIRIVSEKNAIIGETERNKENQFVYHKFTINPSRKPDIRGLFKYGNLPANDVTLNLIDESDQVIQITKTNKSGEFTFKSLKAGKIYQVQVDSSAGVIPENANMFILDEYTGLLLPVSKLSSGLFKFKTLAPLESEDFELMATEDETTVRFSFFAQLFSKLPMDLPEGLEIYIVDDDGTIIATARTDRFGKFKYEKLPIRDQYLLRISEDDPEYILRVISESGEVIGYLKRNEKGEFIFNPKELMKEKASMVASDGGSETKASSGDVPGTKKITANSAAGVHFSFDSWSLNDNSKRSLDNVITRLKNDPTLFIEVNSHTDSRGPAEYNMWLSQQRSESIKAYLTSHGIVENRITLKNFGESSLLNDCADGVDCPLSKHAENRRTEIKLLK